MRNTIFYFFISLLAFHSSISKAQNLVPNGDFENFIVCPPNYECIGCAPPWQSANTYIAPSYFNACAPLASKVSIPVNTNSLLGFQMPHSGNGYVGLNLFQDSVPYPIHYLEVLLNDSLKKDRQYCLTFYASLWNFSKYGIDALGAYFSNMPIANCSLYTCVLNYTPQIANPPGNILMDTLNWMPIGGCFVAQGGEKYLIIGNFTPYNQIQKALNDTGLVPWSTYYYIDDVSLYEDTALNIKEKAFESQFSVSPNPCDRVFNLQFLNTDLPVKILLSDLSGARIKEINVSKNSEAVDVSNIANGAYFLKCFFASGKCTTRKLIIAHN